MPTLSPKENQLLAALNQLLYEVRDTIPLDMREKHLRMAINEADAISREVEGRPTIQRTKV